MSEIATRSYILNNICASGMAGEPNECPTAKQINAMELLNTKGTYSDNELVKIEDVVIGTKGKAIRVHFTIGLTGGADLEYFAINSSTTEASYTLWSSFKTQTIQINSVKGSTNNSSVVQIRVGDTGSDRKFVYSDDSSYNNSKTVVGKKLDYSFGNYNKWLSEVNNIYITIDNK